MTRLEHVWFEKRRVIDAGAHVSEHLPGLHEQNITTSATGYMEGKTETQT